MSTLTALGVIFAVGIPTYLMRASLIVVLAGRSVPAPMQRVLRNIGPAVLAALTVNLVATGSDGQFEVSTVEVIAIAVALVAAIWRRNLLVTLTAGMITLWVLTPVFN